MGLALSRARTVRSKATQEHPLQTHLLIAPLVGLAACGGTVTPPSEHAGVVSGVPGGETEAAAGRSASGPSWMPRSSESESEGAGTIVLKGDRATARKAGDADACDEMCAATSVCDPASGGCVPHCADSPCVSGWSCDGSTGLCASDHPTCGLCREGQVCDPALGVCVSNCAWAGCMGGQCDRDTGFCVE